MTDKLIPMAICYDFDFTLSPGNMQDFGFMDAIGCKNPQDFWDKSNKLAKDQQGDENAAYMYMMIKIAQEKGIEVNKKTFKEFAKNIKFFAGVETWFKRINEYAKSKGIEMKHYIISSGLKEMIEGTSIASEFAQIYASSFMFDENEVPFWPGVVLNYTSKTQYLFRINKGFEDVTDKRVNEYTPEAERAIPFSNMIYIGDGDTDVPCMQILKNSNGHSIAVYDPENEKRCARAKSLLDEARVNFTTPANYSENSPIEKYIKSVIDKISNN